MRHMIGIVLLALTLGALGALSACSGAVAPSPSPTWTPAPKLTADPQSFNWDSPTKLQGEQSFDGWASSDPFTLPAGPETLAGFVWVDGSRAPRVTVRLVPVPKPVSFEGYSLASAKISFLRNPPKDEAVVNGWFPYTLPAGRYRLEVRQTSGGGSLVSYDELDVAGVK
jgi:hypothetical protein